MNLDEALRVARELDAFDPLGPGADAVDAAQTLAAAIERVRLRCDEIHAASREWDVSARPGGFMHCCKVHELLEGEPDSGRQ